MKGIYSGILFSLALVSSPVHAECPAVKYLEISYKLVSDPADCNRQAVPPSPKLKPKLAPPNTESIVPKPTLGPDDAPPPLAAPRPKVEALDLGGKSLTPVKPKQEKIQVAEEYTPSRHGLDILPPQFIPRKK